ncbi:hypothetical protein CsSME_00028390 [Camellia sinensis var. sinensis]
MALSVALALSLLVDKATFRAEPDVIAIALAMQSAIMMARKIAEIGRWHYDAVERLGILEGQLEAEKGKVVVVVADLSVATAKAEEEQTKAAATDEKAQHADLLRKVTEERANLIDGSLKSAQKEISKLKAELEVERKVKKLAAADAAKAFAARELKANELYADKAVKFENQGFKHG